MTETTTVSKPEQMSFGADVSRLLEIVAHALYSNHDVFLRELISNASDACDRLRYESISRPELTKDDTNFRVQVYKDTEYRYLSVADNGIGMTRDELIANLGTIAKSGTRALVEQLKEGGKDKLSLIGQFGVGFYASFMVANTVEVISRFAGSDEAWHWTSDGRTGFEVREATDAEKAELISNRGTLIKLHIHDDASEFMIDEKLTQVIRTYSDHINVPVYLGKKIDGEEAINKAAALWMRSRSEVTEEQYTEFYHTLSMGLDQPFCTSHWRAEGKIEYNALLYVPTLRPWDLYDPSRKNGTRLYVKRVFITDNAEGLMYPWLRFVKGVIDSEDLPLNISREMLQHNPVINKIRSSVATRILTDLERLSREDKVGFNAFLGQFGSVLKEGLYDAVEHRDMLFRVCRFASTHNDGEMVSLLEYAGRMKEGQTDIYYISGENLDNLKNSPQLEGFRARGLEVLLMTDTIDDFWLQQVPQYGEVNFKSITKGSIDLSKFAPDELPPAHDKKTDDSLTSLLGKLKDLLKSDVSDVRLSSRLTDSPVCLVAAENAVDMHMERVLKIHQKYDAKANNRILEINGDHALIQRLADEEAGSSDFNDIAHLLLDQARIIQGEPVPDPTAFARRMANFMQRGLAA